MTPRQQAIWEKSARMALRETEKFNEGQFDDLFYRVALDYYTKLLIIDLKKDKEWKMNAEERELKERRSLSKLSPWYSEDREVPTEEAPKKNLEDENTGAEENDWGKFESLWWPQKIKYWNKEFDLWGFFSYLKAIKSKKRTDSHQSYQSKRVAVFSYQYLSHSFSRIILAKQI